MAANQFFQSTTRRVPLKVFLSSDHITEADNTHTVAVTISKNGGAFANPSTGATNATYIGNGWWYVDLSTTDTNTLGPLLVRGVASGCDVSEVNAQVIVPWTAVADLATDYVRRNQITDLPTLTRSGTAQSGSTSTTITLDASASATDNFYNGQIVYLTGGAGAGQAALISDYVGATKVATIGSTWATTPDNTTTFAILAFGPIRLSSSN